MNSEFIAQLGAQWFWEQFGRSITDKALDAVKLRWAKFHWNEAEIKYRERIYDLHGTVRILGYPHPINVDEIYTDVYALDRPTALKRFNISEVIDKFEGRELTQYKAKRIPLLRLAVNEKRLYLLGKPGSGKTTFLKYLALQACKGKITRTPILISLKEWADSGLELLDYINLQFEICQFPETNEFVTCLLSKAEAFLLFDGLDEVSQENNRRRKIINALSLFSRRYPELPICITCRIAASEYLFEHFVILEIAEFNNKQILQFARKWFHADRSKLERFTDGLAKPEHQGLFELASTPLLLALLCLAFDEIGYFPTRRVDLYKDALDALMRKWDASRGIQRDEIYKKLSIVRKEQLLSRIAAKYFENGIYLFKQDDLTKEISNYINQLPPIDYWEDSPDGLVILKSIEAQHGILTERAHGIYSFLHLTFQEYFTARYIFENSNKKIFTNLLNNYLVDNRWIEIFLMVSSLLSEADEFFNVFLHSINNIIEDEVCKKLLYWVERKSALSKLPPVCSRGIIMYVIFSHFVQNFEDHLDIETKLLPQAQQLAHLLTFDHVTVALGYPPLHIRNRIHLFDSKFNLAFDLRLATEIGINFNPHEFDRMTSMEPKHVEMFNYYVRANILFLDCLQLAWVSDRKIIGERFLLPPQ